MLDPFAAVTLFKNHPSRLDATANGATLAHRASRNRSVLRNCRGLGCAAALAYWTEAPASGGQARETVRDISRSHCLHVCRAAIRLYPALHRPTLPTISHLSH